VSAFAAVDALLEDAVGVVFPAAQLVVLDGLEKKHERSYGNCANDTLFDLASLTKPLCTATLCMQLEERGALSLDEEPRPGVTVRQLLAHASGLPAWKLLPLAGAAHPPVGARAFLQREPLEAPPGTRAVYSDLGFILLGMHLEQRTGRFLEVMFAEEIARPLGVEVAFLPPPARCAPTEGDLRGVVHDENARALGGVAGHAGLFGHARDVARIAHALLAAWATAPPAATSTAAPPAAPEKRTNVRAFSEPSEKNERSFFSGGAVRKFWAPSGVAGSTWCLGWDRPAAVGSSAGERWPRDGVGHLGFTGCSLWLDPARGRAVVLLTNRVHPTRANDRIKQLRPVLHDAVVAALE
jgi:CubicO group peptidase (beta-lactamase class C family)